MDDLPLNDWDFWVPFLLQTGKWKDFMLYLFMSCTALSRAIYLCADLLIFTYTLVTIQIGPIQ